MQRLIFLLVGLVIAGAIAVTVMDSGKAPPPEHGGQTSLRLSARELERMVAGPMALVEKKDMAGASRLFEADLARARGKGGLKPGDLLTAYGVQLRVADREKESIPYFRRAVDAYRSAAPGSPELALALSDYARVLIEDRPDNPAPEARAALREALRIREATLGPKNAETANAYVHLGALEGLPVHTRRDPARVQAAANLIRTGIRLLPSTPNAADHDLRHARVDLAQLFARNGDVEGAFKAGREYMAAESDRGGSDLGSVAETFEKAGDTTTGQRYRLEFGIPDPPKPGELSAEPPAIKNAGRLRAY